MMFFDRSNVSNPLSFNEEKTFGFQWKVQLENNPRANFNWPPAIKTQLDNALYSCHENHCAYCDGYPLKDDRGFSIDHFRPKKKYPLLVSIWINLFPACVECQKRNNTFSKNLIKPDQIGYHFERYFIYDPFSGEIKPNPAATHEIQERANVTIRIFKLNLGNKPSNRKKAIDHFNGQLIPIEERPYRYGY